MATMCPKCKNGTLKKGDKMVYCSNYKPTKKGDSWVNEGSCDFKIMYKNKIWGEDLTPADIKKLVDGGELVNKRGDKMKLDLGNEYFTVIEKVEDEDL